MTSENSSENSSENTRSPRHCSGCHTCHACSCRNSCHGKWLKIGIALSLLFSIIALLVSLCNGHDDYGRGGHHKGYHDGPPIMRGGWERPDHGPGEMQGGWGRPDHGPEGQESAPSVRPVPRGMNGGASPEDYPPRDK